MVDEATRAALDALNAAVGGKYRLDLVEPGALEPAPVNARFMTAEQFKVLRENVERDGGLASVPLCWRTPAGKLRVLSGNHRVRAAVAAGRPQILVLYTDEEMTRDQEVAVQLSHNAIVGQDDPAILRKLWSEVKEIEWKQYSGLDDKLLEQLAPVSMLAISEVRLDTRTAFFVFLPEEEERLEDALASATATAKADTLHLARFADYDRALDALTKLRDAHNVKNSAVALMLLLDVFERHQVELQDGYLDEAGAPKHAGMVPIASILGDDRLPAADAAALKRAVDRMVDANLVPADERWRALALLAAPAATP